MATEPAPRLSIEAVAAEPEPRQESQAAPRTSISDAARTMPARPEGLAADPSPNSQPQPAASPVAAAAAAAVAANVAGKSVHAAYQVPVQQINLPQVAFEVVRQVQAGNSRFQIRLDPPELGRIDVRLDVDRGGNVNARMVVERSETLDLMQRDQRTLERALAQAGLDTSKTNLEFSLRQNPFGQQGGGNGHGDDKGTLLRNSGDVAGAVESVPELTTQTLYRGSTSASGVNLFV